MKFLPILNRGSFGAKIFFWFTVFILIIYVSFSAFFIYYQNKSLRRDLIHEGKQMARLLAYNVRLGVFAENDEWLRDPVESIMQSRETVLVQIFESSGRELKKEQRADPANTKIQTDLKDRGEIAKRLKENRKVLYFETDEYIEFWAPVISKTNYFEGEDLFFENDLLPKKERMIGFVRLLLTKSFMKKSLNDILLKSIFMPFLFLVPAWIIAYLVVRGITKPLNRLIDGVRAMEAEGAVRKVPVETKDEIGKLAQTFNNMAESLERREIEKQQLEEQLRHAQKMEAIGTLAGGIAHDFNNILNVIISSGDLLCKKTEMDEVSSRYIGLIMSAARRGAALTQGLLAFSRKQRVNSRPVNVNEVIRGMEDILRRLLDEKIELDIHLSKGDLIIVADRGHIEQVLMNLTTNAKDAMPDGGSLKITTQYVEINEQSFISGDSVSPGQYALITVSDTGTGIDGLIKERMFDPFFTTKDVGRGTGLGLSMVYGIVRQHRGVIDVSSEVGKGTTFKIYFPLKEIVVEENISEALPEPRGGSETILVAEDDEDVRGLTASLLQQYGYEVIEAVNGNDAVEKFVLNKERVKLLLLDVIMPEKNGKEVYDEIKKINPHIKALFLSGYAADVMDNISRDEGLGTNQEKVVFLLKPVLPDQLLSKMREVLDQ